MKILVLLRIIGNPYPIIAQEMDYSGSEDDLGMQVAHYCNGIIPHEMWHDVGIKKLESGEKMYITRKK